MERFDHLEIGAELVVARARRLRLLHAPRIDARLQLRRGLEFQPSVSLARLRFSSRLSRD